MWEIIVLSLYSLSVFFITLFSVGQLSLLILYFRNRDKKYIPLTEFELPLVTIQLPLYNERYVIERLLNAISLIDYPKEKLEIQILDDSTDDSSSICTTKREELQKAGFNVQYLHRNNRLGYKAGALEEGLLKARGEYIAIFDADFIPQPDFLMRTIPYFTTEQTGLVQTRWGHINASKSWLTRVQELGLNGHFLIDQEGRNKSGMFMSFNGTAGVWRKSCIIDAGGWQFDTLTEDLDLSYRAQMKGWQLRYCPEIVTPAELPFLLSAVQTQQFRWIKGGIETSRKILGKLWACKLPLSVKIFGSFHLLSNYIYLFILLSSILSVPAMFVKNLSPQYGLFFQLSTIFFLVFLINFAYCFTTIRIEEKSFSRAFLQIIQVFPMAILISLGMSYHNSTAIFQGISGKKTAFVRTPKFKMGGSEITGITAYHEGESLIKRLPEMLLFLYFFFAVAAGIYFRDIGFIPYHLVMLSGFGVILYYAYVQARFKEEG